jgi:hypothetical protein
MQIDDELASFLTSPVMIIVGTCDANGRSDIGRGVGARVAGDAGVVELVVSAWQWPRTAENLRGNGRVAITFARPTDYVSYQVKGQATVRDADPDALALSDHYMARIAIVLTSLGMSHDLIAPWLTSRDAIIARVVVESVYVQTPGAKAGQSLA